jgi:hypothetical protein
MDLTVENMFVDKSYEAKNLVSGKLLSALDRKRMLVHVVADITQKILSMPGANPVGLAITVQLVQGTDSDGHPDLLVTATCPQYELSDSFFA